MSNEYQDVPEHQELTPEDLELLATFDAMEIPEQESLQSPDLVQSPSLEENSGYLTDDPDALDMLSLFMLEAREDLTSLRSDLGLLEQESHPDSPHLNAIRRIAHKLKGSGGTVGCQYVSTIAYYIQALIDLVQQSDLEYMTGLIILVQALAALEATVESISSQGYESSKPLTDLDQRCIQITGLSLQDISMLKPGSTPPLSPWESAQITDQDQERPEETHSQLIAEQSLHPSSSPSSPSLEEVTRMMRVDPRRFDTLVQRTEFMIEQSAPLENARTQVEVALQELNAAQARLQRLDLLLATIPQVFQPRNPAPESGENVKNRSSSSLIAKILDEMPHRTGQTRQRRGKIHLQHLPDNEMRMWDEMEIDRYTESDVLAFSFNEAIADVTTAATNLRTAFSKLHRTTSAFVEQASMVRADALLMRSAPLTRLLPRLRQVIEQGASQQRRPIIFEVTGETIEIDQDLTEDLAAILEQLIDNYVKNPVENVQTNEPAMIWINALNQGNDLRLEVGFSHIAQGGSLDIVEEKVTRLKGSVRPQRNDQGGINFYLQIPRSRGSVRGLLVKARDQQVLIPFSQVQRLGFFVNDQREPAYHLNELMGLPVKMKEPGEIRPILIIHPKEMRIDMEVEEVIGEVELMMRPLPSYLQRPGVIGTAIDGQGNVLLVLDIANLVKSGLQTGLHSTMLPSGGSHRNIPSILVVDDAVSIRQSLLRTLQRANYQVHEARDGMEALELLLERPVDLLLLDIEMPHLNGYDLLSILRGYPQLSYLKIIMLSSRSSEKHRKRAMELGAHDYLTKPCPEEVLLGTLQKLLPHKSAVPK